MTEDTPLLLTVKEAAALLRMTTKAVYLAVERQQLPGVVRLFASGRGIRFRRDDLYRHVGLLPALGRRAKK